jgi:hypothetical protein
MDSLRHKGVPDEAMHDELPKCFKAGALSLASSGSNYFASKTTLNPCQGCVSLAGRFGLSSDLFQRGSELALDQ